MYHWDPVLYVAESTSATWASLTGSGVLYVTITYIVAHIDSYIFDPAKTPPGAPGRGGGSG